MTARQLRRVQPVMGRYGFRLLDPLEPPEALAWQEFALCPEVDAEIFFPQKGQPSKPAKQVCAVCPVRSECLEFALDNDERYGVFGGKSERERRAIKRSRAKEAA